MLTLEDRGTFEKLLADYAVAELEYRRAIEKKHAALHACNDYVNNHEGAAIRSAIDHHDRLPWNSPVAWFKYNVRNDVHDVVFGSAQPAPSTGWFPVFEKRVPAESVQGAPSFAGARYHKYDAPDVLDPIGSNLAKDAMPDPLEPGDGPCAPEVPFPLPGFNETPTKPAAVTVALNLADVPPQSHAFRDTFRERDPMYGQTPDGKPLLNDRGRK